MVRPKRSKQHPDLQTAIKEVARKQIAENGAPALSLRAIARELKITAPAIYNYYPSRDDLVTALVIDAYASFAEGERGSIAPGGLADLVVLSGDPMACQPGELAALRPQMTIVGGRVAWRADESGAA